MLIVLTGPESSGKTALARALQSHFSVPGVEAAARAYLLDRVAYLPADLRRIALQQLDWERQVSSAAAQAGQAAWSIADTDLQVLYIWWQEKFGPAPAWLCRPFCSSLADAVENVAALIWFKQASNAFVIMVVEDARMAAIKLHAEAGGLPERAEPLGLGQVINTVDQRIAQAGVEERLEFGNEKPATVEDILAGLGPAANVSMAQHLELVVGVDDWVQDGGPVAGIG